MGFWHTGYFEFHDDFVLEMPVAPPVPEFACAQCSRVFWSFEELRNHRFIDHPLRRPTLFLRERELGARAAVITTPMSPSEIRTENCTSVRINGKSAALSSLGATVASLPSGLHRISLSTVALEAEFSLDIRIADRRDLEGVEKEFEALARRLHLDSREIETFIDRTQGHRSAGLYADGVCEYLYGVLAKERVGGVTIPFEKYVEKLTKAAEELSAYDRPLSRTLRCLIGFHFNHFSEAARLAPASRAGRSAERFALQLLQRDGAETADHEAGPAPTRIESMATDLYTERILKWSSASSGALQKEVPEMEAALEGPMPELDKVKIRILLARTCTAAGDLPGARRHVTALRNVSGLDEWAESSLRKIKELPHGTV